MDIPELYAYLVRARRDLWATLEAVPDEVLSRPLLQGERFHCIKDLVAHTAGVEDGWLHYTILQDTPVEEAFPKLRDAGNGPVYADFPLPELLDYWRAVEQSTLAYLATLTGTELQRTVEDSPTEHFQLEGLLWHVMLHEVRHTAQICALLRTQGFRPPSLDLLFYLPNLHPDAAQV
ncbi:hypothetical protein DKM44_13725 [Deinococcus irradiatisoli]|uniref:Damage-inducible protein DinB n=1 Tax=Deinococcus irradiatisoli TaxID=2202254 RepID=A0A2Z3JGN6_9DEIO|nr:DinB family protein [Deinococcus irradiatisoli]AWN24155.1 hypothetical protein DKM44_13725 [Deinococcus irradiatisoli]